MSKELEEALWSVPINSTQVIQKYIRDNYISKAKIRKIIEKYQSQFQLCDKIDSRTMITKKSMIRDIVSLLEALVENE